MLKNSKKLVFALLIIVSVFFFLFPLDKVFGAADITWSTSSLSQARSNLSATSIGTKAIFAGGSFSSNPPYISDKIDIYDVSTGGWISTTFQGRRYMAATSVGNKALFAGGTYYGYSTWSQYPGEFPSNRVDIYDDTTQLWSTASLSQSRSRLAAATVGSKAFFAGGVAWTGFSNVVDIYDDSTGLWSTSSLSLARQTLAAAAAGNLVLFGGGDTGSENLVTNRVDIYNVDSNTWSTSSLSQARTNLVAASAGNKVLFAGGISSQGFSNVVDIYDISTGVWSTAALSVTRHGLTAVRLGDKVLFAGGYSNPFIYPYYTSRIDVYDATNNSWNTKELSLARGFLAATTVDNKAFFGGGTGAGGRTSLVDVATGILVNKPPVANTGPDLGGNEGSSLIFDGSGSSDPDPGDSIASYQWDFGDGTTGDGAVVSHTYADNGVYTATLIVTDTQGATGTDTATVTVNNVAPTVGTINIPATINLNSPFDASADFTDPGILDTHTAVWNWGDGNISISAVSESSGSGTVMGNHTYSSEGLYIVALTITDKDGATDQSQATVEAKRQLTELQPAEVWIGLKNSDDVGIKFDFLAEVYKDGMELVGSGELDKVAGGSSGFNNARLNSIPLTLFSPVDFPEGSTLSIKLYVRNTCYGNTHNSGTARLWYNDSAANSHFGATIANTMSDHYLLNGFILGTSVGPGPKKYIDVAAGKPCGAFKPFGTWNKTL